MRTEGDGNDPIAYAVQAMVNAIAPDSELPLTNVRHDGQFGINVENANAEVGVRRVTLWHV